MFHLKNGKDEEDCSMLVKEIGLHTVNSQNSTHNSF